MSDLFWLTDAQMVRFEPFFPKFHGKPHVDDRRVLSGIIFINRNGLRWRDREIMNGQTSGAIGSSPMGDGPRTMPNATYLKAHRTATSLGVKFGGLENSLGDCFPDERGVDAWLTEPKAA